MILSVRIKVGNPISTTKILMLVGSEDFLEAIFLEDEAITF